MEMKKVRFYIMILICVIICSSCYENRKISDTAIIFPFNPTSSSKNLKYEIMIVEHVKGRGGWAFVHNASLKKYTYDNNKWIYTNAITGKIEADSLIYTHHQRKLDYPWNQSHLKGNIEILSDSILIVYFQIPFYKDGVNIDHWEDCQYNGYYKILLKNRPSPLIEKD
jgi:hypothetical protein